MALSLAPVGNHFNTSGTVPFMARPADIERWKKGKDHWNAWAEDMFARRRSLEEQGQWIVDTRGNIQNPEARDWLRQASIDFALHEFDEAADFSGFMFPADITFARARFLLDADFNEAAFLGRSWFDRAAFAGNAKFNATLFAGDAKFEKTHFGGTAGFAGTLFERNASFTDAGFDEKANFHTCRFSGPARFEATSFARRADFAGATFDVSTTFGEASFSDGATFASARFAGAATFVRMRSQGPFTIVGTEFSEVPDFTEAGLATPVRLDETGIADAPLFAFTTDRTLAERYRALKRMASAGRDRERERFFHAAEFRARRGNDALPFGAGSAGFWLGYAYQLISDFGRSVFRPLGIWALSALVFVQIYFQRFVFISGTGLPTVQAEGQMYWFERMLLYLKADDAGVISCIAGSGRPIMEAMLVSFDRASLSLVLGAARVGRAEACLFGLHQSLLGSAPVAATPYYLIWYGAAQMILSAILLGLFVLALRNRFRLR